MDRPARLQVDPATITADDKPPQTGTVFNIWYLKWSHGDSSSRQVHERSKFRVDIAKDQGYTKAKPGASICLFFARGCCYKGLQCEYFHRLPNANDASSLVTDCFGRDRTTQARDDHDGVGVINQRNCSLWVGGIDLPPKLLEATLSKAFSEFGEVVKCRVLSKKRCGFVTYASESLAQFAKEAMQNQSVGNNDVIQVRWATADPSQKARQEEIEARQNEATETVKRLLKELEEEEEEQQQQDAPVVQNEELPPASPPSYEGPRKVRKLDFSHLTASQAVTTSEKLVEYSSSDED